jgi:hypothetical protein
MKSRKETHRKKSKFVIGLVSLSMMAVLTMNVSFADEDLQVKLQRWYETKSQNAMGIIDQAVKSEVEIQKERLRKEVQLKMAQSAADLDDFTKEQKELRVRAVRDYTDELISQIIFSNEEEKEALSEQLVDIQENAIKQMKQIANGYEPTVNEPPQVNPNTTSTEAQNKKQETAATNEGADEIAPESDKNKGNERSPEVIGKVKNNSSKTPEGIAAPVENPPDGQVEIERDPE